MRYPPVWKDAYGLLSPSLILTQLGLVAAVFGFVVVWLRMPDASVLEVAGSCLLVLIVIAAAGAEESRIILRLAGRESHAGRLARGTLWLCLGVAACLLWSAWVTRVAGRDALLAGYLNSQIPRQLRYGLTFDHLLLGLSWMWSAVRWMGAGAIASVVFPLISGGHAGRAGLVAVRSLSFWVALLFGVSAAALFTEALMAWMPLRGLSLETVSLVLRLAVAALVDGIVACWLLASLGVCVRRADEAYAASAGGPAESQRRTAGAP